MDNTPRGTHDVPLTTPQDAFCDICQTSHVARIAPDTAPTAVKNRVAILCPQLGYVARFEFKSHRLEVLPRFIDDVHLSRPLIRNASRDVRSNPRYHPYHRRVLYPPPYAAAPAAVPQPEAPRPLAPAATEIKISLTKTNHHVTRSTNHAVRLTAFRLASIPDHILRQIDYDEAYLPTLEVLLGNQWRELDPDVEIDISEVRGQGLLQLRAVSKTFPLTYARDMAIGLRMYSTTCEHNQEASPPAVFNVAFGGTPWQAEAFFDALRHWQTLDHDMQDIFCAAERNDGFMWARIVGAADHARFAAHAAKRAGPSTTSRGKRAREASFEPEIIPQPKARVATVKRECQGDVRRKRKRTSTPRFIPADGNDSDVLIEDVIDVDNL